MAGSLSGGEQQMLPIARGLMTDPKLIMFDEPSLGLAPAVVDDMFDIFVQINKEIMSPSCWLNKTLLWHFLSQNELMYWKTE